MLEVETCQRANLYSITYFQAMARDNWLNETLWDDTLFVFDDETLQETLVKSLGINWKK